MLDHQSLPSVIHNRLHSVSNILPSPTFKFNSVLEPPGNLFDASSHVALAEGGGFVEEGFTIEIEEVKNFD
jgi:hypothetical protein